MSRLFATCFGSWEDHSPQRNRRRRHHDSETESSYDSDDESDSDDNEDDDRFNRVERGEARTGAFRKEEDIRLEEVLSVDEELNGFGKNEVRRNVSVVDEGQSLAAPPVVSLFVDHVLRESQRGYLQRTKQDASPSTARDVLPQVALLHEANRMLPEGSPGFFQAVVKARAEGRMSSGGSISSSGSSVEESGRSSTSSGIGDSFTSGNDTGGSGAAGGKKQNKGSAMKAGNGSEGKTKSKSEWSQGVVQNIVVEEDELASGLGHMSHFMAGRRATERISVATVEGVHLPTGAREWGAARMLNSELPGWTTSKIGKAFNRNRIGHHSNVVRVEDHPKSTGISTNSNLHLENSSGNLNGIGNQFSYISTLPKNSRNHITVRQSIRRF